MTPLVSSSYVNLSGVAIPPCGVLQFTGVPTITATGKIVMNAVACGLGNGPFFIDSGGGASASGDGRYGTAFRAGEGFAWTAFGCDTPANLVPWMDVGPINNDFIVNTNGVGLWYAGLYQSNASLGIVTGYGSSIGRILVTLHNFAIHSTDCGSSGSSSSSKGSSSSGSSSSSSGCPTIVTDVKCDGGTLVVTKKQYNIQPCS